MTRDAPKLRRVRRLDSIRLDKNDSTYFTDEGYLVDHPILTSCGIFEYTNPDGSIRRELRLPKYVFDENSLKTYRGKPVIITHDAGVVDKNNVDKEQIGTILSDGYEDGEDVRAEIIIHNTDSMHKCGLKELSLGYNLDLLEEPGVWNGEPYDAIQTNIAINHLALVASARAGEQARLNIDGSDEPELKGGKAMINEKNSQVTGGENLSPEELKEAIEDYRKKIATRATEDEGEEPIEEVATDEADPVEEVATDSEETAKEVEATTETDSEDVEATGTSPSEVAQIVKDRRDKRNCDEDVEPKTVIAQQDEEIDMLLATIDKLIAEEKLDSDCDETKTDSEEEEKLDSSDDEGKTLNADSADRIVRQRLSICRTGDKIGMTGLENMSIKQAKKAIISKVLPSMRMDGKSNAYIDAMYDIAVNEANKRKGVDYQKMQMTANASPRRNDSAESMAVSARKKMIERQGGND